MKEFLQVLRRFVPPYKKYLALSVLFNILSAVFYWLAIGCDDVLKNGRILPFFGIYHPHKNRHCA